MRKLFMPNRNARLRTRQQRANALCRPGQTRAERATRACHRVGARTTFSCCLQPPGPSWVQLRFAVISLENLVITLLAEGSPRQLISHARWPPMSCAAPATPIIE